MLAAIQRSGMLCGLVLPSSNPVLSQVRRFRQMEILMYRFPRSKPVARVVASAASFALAFSLIGCAGFSTTATPSPTAGVAFAGNLHGGQQPVSGAQVYLLSADTVSYAGGTHPILNPGPGIQLNQYGAYYATTDAGGNFAFANYTCPSPTSQVYLLALGGNPGLSGNQNNTAITSIDVVGNCNSIKTTSFFSINEVTTAAFVTAVQQFMGSFNTVGAPASNQAGLATAFALAADLANPATGAARSTNVAGTGSVPQSKLNTLGNILAPCINSSAPSSPTCTSLFTAVTPAGGARPVEVVGAMLLIAQNPGNNVAAISGQTNPAAPFQPSLAKAPNDLSIGITYSGGGMTAPGNIVIDAAGDAYIGNSPSTAGAAGTDSIVGFGPNGAILTGATGYTAGIHAPAGLAIDNAGSIWSTDAASGNNPDQVVKLSSSGALVGAFSTNISNPQGIAIDTGNNAWVANQNSSNLVKLNATDTAITATVTSNGFAFPTGIGIDGSGNIFAAGSGSNTILKFSSAGTVLSPAGGYPASSLNQPTGISLDGSGNVWTINNVGSTITKITNTGTLIAPSAPQPSIANAYVLSIDGVGGAWYANCRAACGANTTSPDNLTHVLASQGQATGTADGYQDAKLSRVGTSAIDGSGNVWVTNNGGGTVTEFVGLASPVITPLAAAVTQNKLGTRP